MSKHVVILPFGPAGQYYGVFRHIGSAVTNGNITTCFNISGVGARGPDAAKHVVILPFVTADPMCVNTP